MKHARILIDLLEVAYGLRSWCIVTLQKEKKRDESADIRRSRRSMRLRFVKIQSKLTALLDDSGVLQLLTPEEAGPK